MKKWIVIPALAGAVVLGGVAIVSGANSNEAFAKVDNLVKEEVKVKGVETVAPKGILSIEEAKAIAVKSVGGKVTEIELEREKSGYVYEIEVRSEGIEYDLDIDAKTGEILRTEKDDDDRFEKSDLSNEKIITVEEAVAIAMKQAKGTVTEAELDDDDGRLYYDLEIEDGTYEYEFEIDAITGEIIKFEKENDND